MNGDHFPQLLTMISSEGGQGSVVMKFTQINIPPFSSGISQLATFDDTGGYVRQSSIVSHQYFIDLSLIFRYISIANSLFQSCDLTVILFPAGKGVLFLWNQARRWDVVIKICQWIGFRQKLHRNIWRFQPSMFP
jgi:hypothetical protein